VRLKLPLDLESLLRILKSNIFEEENLFFCGSSKIANKFSLKSYITAGSGFSKNSLDPD
jgi:hypothetical protein